MDERPGRRRFRWIVLALAIAEGRFALVVFRDFFASCDCLLLAMSSAMERFRCRFRLFAGDSSLPFVIVGVFPFAMVSVVTGMLLVRCRL